MMRLADRIREAGDLLDECVIGWDSLNEPAEGMIGLADLGSLPKSQALKKGPTPTAFEGFRLGMGEAVTVDNWVRCPRLLPFPSLSRWLTRAYLASASELHGHGPCKVRHGHHRPKGQDVLARTRGRGQRLALGLEARPWLEARHLQYVPSRLRHPSGQLTLTSRSTSLGSARRLGPSDANAPPSRLLCDRAIGPVRLGQARLIRARLLAADLGYLGPRHPQGSPRSDPLHSAAGLPPAAAARGGGARRSGVLFATLVRWPHPPVRFSSYFSWRALECPV